MDAKTCTILSGWAIAEPRYYLLWCLICVLVMRGVLSYLKAWAAGPPECEHDDEEDGKKDAKKPRVFPSKWSWWKRFWEAFKGFGESKLAGGWLGPVIGFAEILSYPVLISTGNLDVIGGWLAIKTAGGWRIWQDHPRAFNRFLVATLANVVFAWLLAKYFITT